MRTFALLPAAGKSARMGRPKLELPLGGRTVLERVLDTLHAAQIADVLVVLGPHGGKLAAMADGHGNNADQDDGDDSEQHHGHRRNRAMLLP